MVMGQTDDETTEEPPSRGSTLHFGPRYERSAFFEATERHDCRGYGVYNHTYLPMDYDDPIEEYWRLLEDVVLWDVGAQRIIEISGPDARAFTDILTPRDLSNCSVGQVKYAPLTAEDGGIVNDPVLFRLEEDRFWLSLADSDAGLWARGVACDSPYDVQVGRVDAQPVQVQGPKSKHVIEDLFEPEVTDLDYYWCTETQLEDTPVMVSRTGWTGEVGYEVFLRDLDRGDEMWRRIMEAGDPYDISPTPPSEIRRIEAGLFSYGGDMTIENNPLQLSGMERLVDIEQGTDYIGREALERIDQEGVDRKLVGIDIEGEIEPSIAHPWTAYHEGTEVGRVTAATWSPRLERSIGYVWVPIDLADPNTVLRVETPASKTHAATTASLPFYDPEKGEPRSV